MNGFIYLDNAATQQPLKCVTAAQSDADSRFWGNPASLYSVGLDAARELARARTVVANAVSAPPSCVYFTSGGTESNNTAIFSAARMLKKRGKHIVTTAFEHPSVLNPVKSLEAEGFEVTYLSPDTKGYISEEQIAAAVRSDTVLVSIMAQNNETGALNDIKNVKQIIKAANSPALFHCDCVQAFMKTPLTFSDFDFMSVSAHKIGGPKGVGALFAGTKVMPLLLGGGQEKGIRSGTVPVPLICGFAAAVENQPHFDALPLYEYAKEKLGEYTLNLPQKASPYILNFSVENYKSETLLHYLEKENIFVSSGSACAKGEQSYVLKSMGLKNEITDSAIRISFNHKNTKEDIDRLCKVLKMAQSELIPIKRNGIKR
ncbi:MAG: cysteine desulfurase [Oscillospiraceae bacterium]|nr:cysteine desulfurase [Candidatus Equicaccousia limihippi]